MIYIMLIYYDMERFTSSAKRIALPVLNLLFLPVRRSSIMVLWNV